MSYPLNYPTPQNANIQIFNGSEGQSNATQIWVKPQGASFVWFTLIGAGGGGDTATRGGGSGAITNCMVPAFLIPDSLQISIGNPYLPTNTVIFTPDTYLLLNANSASTTSAGAASASNYFSAMGFYQSVAGQNGTTGDVYPSATTFLSGGTGNGFTVTANYGYASDAGPGQGFFQICPIIVGVGGGGNFNTGHGGIGCGGALNGVGGNGLVVIISW